MLLAAYLVSMGAPLFSQVAADTAYPARSQSGNHVLHASYSANSASPDTTGQKPMISETASAQASCTAEPLFTDFSLRANLLRWATLTPDLGVEVRVNRNIGVSVDATYTMWEWNNYHRRYALWYITPEVRYYLGKKGRGYVGVMYKVGSFDYKLTYTGRQGDLMGGGVTGGYRMRFNDMFALDFSLGAGYIRADYEKYVAIDGVRVSRGCESTNWWGPIHAGVSLVWTIF